MEGWGKGPRFCFKELGFQSDLGTKGGTSEAPEREREGDTGTHTQRNKWGEPGRREVETEGHKGLDWVTGGQAHPHPTQILDL